MAVRLVSGARGDWSFAVRPVSGARGNWPLAVRLVLGAQGIGLLFSLGFIKLICFVFRWAFLGRVHLGSPFPDP